MLAPTQIDTVPRGYLAIGAGGAIDASNAPVGPSRTVPIEPDAEDLGLSRLASARLRFQQVSDAAPERTWYGRRETGPRYRRR